uniref:Uncharacterized protein n=1 Tax=Arundo donax TaxID=35708 RepID=A0A0A9A5T8_ARUDO
MLKPDMTVLDHSCCHVCASLDSLTVFREVTSDSLRLFVSCCGPMVPFLDKQ